MEPHPILRQIASLEAQVRSLRGPLLSLPADSQSDAALELQRLRAALDQLQEALRTLPDEAGQNVGNRPATTTEVASGGDELVWTAERTTRLYAINTGLSVALTQAQVGRIVVEQALPALSADAGAVMLLSDGATLRPLVAAGAGDAPIDPAAIAQSSPFGQAVQTAQPVWIETAEELRALSASPSAFPWSDAASLAAVPLIAEDRVLGVMAFRFDMARPFTVADRSFLLVLAQQCAAALERIHLYEQVRQAAALQERNRLARDLHDSVSQALYAIVLAVTVGRANLAKDLGRVARALDNIQSLTGAAQADLRALLFDLRADSIARTGLVNALAERAQFLHLRHGLSVQTELGEEPALSAVCKDALYGIAREALHNAAKHARASKVELKLARTTQGLVLEIKDDGVGFEPDKPRSGHYGLQSMRERASELGAQLHIESGRGKGTNVLVVLPIVDNLTNGQGCNEQDGL